MPEDPIEIVILSEDRPADIPVVEEPPLVPERRRPDAAGRARRLAGKAGAGLRRLTVRAWRSPTVRRATRGVGRRTGAVMSRGTRLVGDQVRRTAERQAQETAAALQTRLQQTDWRQEAKRGAGRGLRWLSGRLAALAARLTPAKDPPPD